MKTRNPTASFPDDIYLFKFNKRNTRKRCEICLKLTIKTPKRCHWRRSGVFIVNFEHISQLFLIVFLLLTLNVGWVIIYNFFKDSTERRLTGVSSSR